MSEIMVGLAPPRPRVPCTAGHTRSYLNLPELARRCLRHLLHFTSQFLDELDGSPSDPARCYPTVASLSPPTLGGREGHEERLPTPFSFIPSSGRGQIYCNYF